MFNPSNETHFSLTVEDYVGDLQVLSFTGTEGISQPYRFDLELVSENPDLDLEKLLHKQAFLAFDPKGSGVHGQIYRVAQGDAGKRLTRYKVSLVPLLQYLHHRTNQRIYQQMSAPKIIALILEEHGIKGNAYKFQLSQPCPDRDYCVQYDETDLHFVQRLCEEEGIHYHFQQSSKGHLLVFGDDQTVFPKLGQPTAYVQGSGMVADEPVIKGFKLRLETRTGRVTRRDYDFEKPRLQLEAAYKPAPCSKPSAHRGGGGFNELRIEDKKGAEQIFIHAQRDWDENIEHDQKIRDGNERHDTVVKNTYTELKAEEHRTTIADRKSEVRVDDHLTIGQNQHIKLGTAQLTSAGKEIHLKAGDKIVIEAGMELTVKAGGSFIKLDAGGVTVVGPVVKINAGGSAGSGTGVGIKPPVLPGAADKVKAGSLMDQAQVNAPPEKVKPKAFFVFSE